MRTALFALSLFLTTGVATACSDSTAPGLVSNVDEARTAWLDGRPDYYRFELRQNGAWFTRHLLVYVAEGEIIAQIPLSGNRMAPDDVSTIDDIWDTILTARTAGWLNSAEFTSDGVPVSLDVGQWELDSGNSYEVTRYKTFTRRTNSMSWQERAESVGTQR